MKVHSIISAALSLAVRYEWIDRNPAERATLPRLRKRQPLLLYAEEIDTATGQYLGNFSQAFTHLAPIEAGSLLIALEQGDGVTCAA